MRIIGYLADAATYCRECLPHRPDGVDSEGNPVGVAFEDAEADYPRHCDACGAFLGGALTAEGEQHVRDFLRRHPDSETAREYREYYAYLFD